jgi:hypothetical protein
MEEIFKLLDERTSNNYKKYLEVIASKPSQNTSRRLLCTFSYAPSLSIIEIADTHDFKVINGKVCLLPNNNFNDWFEKIFARYLN